MDINRRLQNAVRAGKAGRKKGRYTGVKVKAKLWDGDVKVWVYGELGEMEKYGSAYKLRKCENSDYEGWSVLYEDCEVQK